MKKLLLCLFVSAPLCFLSAQQGNLSRPKLVVGVVVDQMRWDYLYRYYDLYDANGGFKRLLGQGFSCENTLIPYVPTITACGHTSIFTGSVPAITGISGNSWWDQDQMRSVYCTEDGSVKTVGSSSPAGQMSPRNLLVTTICDELRLATNFRSKVVGIALKDRGGILPAGHSANAAYWYDNATGNWITSSYYMNELPKWVNEFNGQKMVDKLFQMGWSLLYPVESYVQSTADDKKYEGKPLGAGFPYDLKKFIGKYGTLPVTPYGNTFTAEFAKAAIAGEQLGVDEITDFLTISFSSPDYIGHTFGPNSIEAEDGFLRLDRDLGNLLDYLDAKIGKDQYTLFLSADHGAAHIPEFMIENKIPAGRAPVATAVNNLNNALKMKYGLDELILSDDNYQIHLNHARVDSAHLNLDEMMKWICGQLTEVPGIFRAFPLKDLGAVPLPSHIREMIANGYNPRRNGDIQLLLYPQYIEGYSPVGTTHGVWSPYDAHIPLLWYGWGIRSGKLNREVAMTDIAPTVAALLHIQMPSGSVGHVISEVIK